MYYESTPVVFHIHWRRQFFTTDQGGGWLILISYPLNEVIVVSRLLISLMFVICIYDVQFYSVNNISKFVHVHYL